MNRIIDVHILKWFFPLEIINCFSNVVNICFFSRSYGGEKTPLRLNYVKTNWWWQFWCKEDWTSDSINKFGWEAKIKSVRKNFLKVSSYSQLKIILSYFQNIPNETVCSNTIGNLLRFLLLKCTFINRIY